MNTEKIDQILAQLGKQLGVEELKLQENDATTLVFDKRIELNLECSLDEKYLHLYAMICPIPKEAEKMKAIYDLMMEGHLFGYGTEQAIFGVNHELESFIFFKNLRIETLDFDRFIGELESFLNQFDHWQPKIHKVYHGYETNKPKEKPKGGIKI